MRTFKTESTALTRWVCLAALNIAVVSLYIDAHSWKSLGLLAFAVIAVAAAPSFPRSAAVSYLAVFGLQVLLSGDPPGVSVFLSPLLVFVLSYIGLPASAVVLAPIVWYLGATDIAALDFLPRSADTALLLAVVLAAAVFAGHSIGRGHRTRLQILREWERDIHARRLATAQTLHDTVARSLTSIVLRADALRLRSSSDSDSALLAIADTARQSTAEVNDLLHVLAEDSEPVSASEMSLERLTNETAEFLRDHGFRVEVRAPGQFDVAYPQLRVAREVLAELATNVLRYADSTSTVLIDVDEERLEMRNRVPSMQASSLGSGMGLQWASQLARAHQGLLITSVDSGVWTARLTWKNPGENT